jgi:hypothetical protein
LIRLVLVLSLFLCAVVTQAQYVSSQPGPWNDIATWGGMSPVPDATNSTSIVINHTVTVPN